MDRLRDLCNSIIEKGYSGTALLLMSCLVEKALELATVLAKNFVNSLPLEPVVKSARRVAPEEGVALCRLRINTDLLHSHVHYGKAVFLLAVIRDNYAAEGNEAR